MRSSPEIRLEEESYDHNLGLVELARVGLWLFWSMTMTFSLFDVVAIT